MSRNVPGMVWPYVPGMRKVVTLRLVQACAIALGVLVLAVCASTVVLDSILHTAGTSGPVVEAAELAVAAVPAAAVGVLLAIRRPVIPSDGCC